MRGQWITGCLALCVLLSGGAAHAAMTPLEAIEKLDAVCLALQTSFDPKNFSFSALDAIQPEAGESIDILTVLGDIIFHSGHEALPRDIETASPVMQHVMKSILSDTEGQFLFPDSEDPGLETRVVIWRQCLFGGSTWIVALTQPAADHADAGQPHLKKWAGAFTETGTAPTGDALPKRAGSMHMLTFNAGSNFTAILSSPDRRRVFNGLQYSNHIAAVATSDEPATHGAVWYLTGTLLHTNTSFEGVIRGNARDCMVEEKLFFHAILME